MTVLQPVPRVDSPTREAFEREYVARSRPVVITGAMTGWRALDLWDRDYLLRAIGGAELDVSRCGGRFTDSPAQLERMSFSRFLALAPEPEGRAQAYLMVKQVAQTLPALAGDIQFPGYFQRSTMTNFWCANGRTVTLLHHDTADNLLAVVSGSKRVVLFPPGAQVYPGAWWSRHPVNFSPVDIERPNRARFPRFSTAGALEATLGPGEMLFIPMPWWHQVFSETGCAVNFWWQPAITLRRLHRLVNPELMRLRLRRMVNWLRRRGWPW